MKKRNLVQITLALVTMIILQLACGSSSIPDVISSAIPRQSPTSTEEIPAQIIVSAEPEVIVATAVPQGDAEALVISDYGFGQFDTTVGYGFILENPNSNLAIVNSEYQIAAYDANGTVVETDSGYVDYVFPNQVTGMAGEIYLDEGVIVDRLEIQFNDGYSEPSELTGDFTISKETLTRDDYYTYVVGEIINPFNTLITSLRVSTILYDDSSKIVGGGYSYLNFIDANGTTGLKITSTGTENATHAKIYPNLSSYSLSNDDEVPPSGSSPIELVKSGFAQGEYSVGYGFIVHNPNTGLSIEDSIYHITFYSATDAIIGYVEGYLDVLLPDETLGVSTDSYLVYEEPVDKAVLQMLTGSYLEDKGQLVFTSQNATFVNDTYYPSVTGQVINPYAQQVTDVVITALAFDESGNIIGAGYTYLDFIPASGTSAAEVYVTVSGIPATVELFATLSSFSEFE